MARGYLSSLLAVQASSSPPWPTPGVGLKSSTCNGVPCGTASELYGVCLVYALCLLTFCWLKIGSHGFAIIGPTPPNPTPSLTYQQTRMVFDEPPCKPSDTLHKRPKMQLCRIGVPSECPKKIGRGRIPQLCISFG